MLLTLSGRAAVRLYEEKYHFGGERKPGKPREVFRMSNKEIWEKRRLEAQGHMISTAVPLKYTPRLNVLSLQPR